MPLATSQCKSALELAGVVPTRGAAYRGSAHGARQTADVRAGARRRAGPDLHARGHDATGGVPDNRRCVSALSALRRAERLGEGVIPLSPAEDAPLLIGLDVLVRSLRSGRPHIAPALFLCLFKKVCSDCLARRIKDQGSLADCARTMAALAAGWPLRQLPDAIVKQTVRRSCAFAP